MAMASPAFQQWGDGTASVAYNTNPLFKAPLTSGPQKGPALGFTYPFSSGGAVLPTHGSALQGGPAWGKHPSNVSYALASSVPSKSQVSI